MGEKTKELKERVYENRWYILNCWSDPDQKANAIKVADKLLALITEEASEPSPTVEPQDPAPLPVDPPEFFEPPEWLISETVFPIVGRRFSPGQFIEYVKWVKDNEDYTWSPSGITMHHTAFPDLSIRPDGFTEQHMINMRHGYMTDNGWRHGPHIFTDDHGIWVFNPLSIHGVHAVSYNFTRYGIEMLGNFDTESDWNHPRGIASRQNGQFAAAVLMKYAGISRAKLNFHRHDPETSKTCPGTFVPFSKFEEEVLELSDQI